MRRLNAHRGHDQSRGRADQPLISTDISTQVAPTVTAKKREPNWQRRALEKERQQAQVMNLLEQIEASTGGLLALSKAPPMNDVLAQGTYLVPAGGVWTTGFAQAFAAVMVANLSAHELCVAAAVPAEAKPPQGAGVLFVPSGFWRLVPMRGTALTVYGTATSKFDLAVYIRPQPPAGGQCGTG